MNNLFFSIAIPFYFKNEYSIIQLKRCINSIRIQTFKNYEIVISTQNHYQELINNVFFEGIKILNADTENFIQGNVNNAIKACKGKWIKIIFSDDYFSENSSLEKISNALSNNKKKWAITNSLHFNKNISQIHNPILAFYNKYILEINSIGSPSAVVIENKNPLLFDQKTWMRLDVDYYHALFKKYGSPLHINNVYMINEIHNYQFSNLMINKTKKTMLLLEKELKYLCKKHNYKKLSPIKLFLLKSTLKLKRTIDQLIFKIKIIKTSFY